MVWSCNWSHGIRETVCSLRPCTHVRGLPARQAFCTKHEKEEVGLYPADHISQQAHISAAQTRNGNYPKLYGLYEQTNATAPDRYMSPEGLATRGR